MNVVTASPSVGSIATWRLPMMPLAVACGALLGIVYTLSPMAVWFAVASVLIVWGGAAGLPPVEARWVCGVLVAAIAVRAALVAALFLFGSPDQMWFNTFFGDEQYLLVRSLRLRHLWLGTPLSLEALFDLFDSYGQTSYLDVIAYVQLLIGPAPYGIHLLNSTFYLFGVVLLHRVVRSAFGPVPAMGTLIGVLFFPTLLVWSASGLKESLNFLMVMSVVAATVAIVRANWSWRPLAAVAFVGGLAALRTLRAGAFEITAVGIVLGLAVYFVSLRLWRVGLVGLAIVVLAVPAARSVRVQDATLGLLRPAARMHMGHVFTRGHSYKLLDQRLYDTRLIDSMTWSEAGRFVQRAATSVVLFPAPWDAQSRVELAYVPEQMAWYAILVTAAIGVAAGLRRDVLVTSLFVAYACTALMVVALNTGNVGTLVRHRSFALPFLIALSALGVTAVVDRWSGTSAVRH